MRKALVIGLDSRLYALPLADVIEIMRPLSIEAISGVPPYLRGAAIIRGTPTPVVDLAALLGIPSESAQERFVTVRAGRRQVALSVKTVLGIYELDALTTMQPLPPLLQCASTDIIEKIGILDDRFLVVLQKAWELPEEVWQAVAPQEALS